MKVENCIENSVAFSSVIPSELTKFPIVTNSPSLEKNYSSVDIVVFWCDSLLPPGIWEEFLRKGKLPAGISRRSHFSMDNLEPGRHCSRSGPNSRALSGEWSCQGWGVASQRTSPEQLYVSEWLYSGFLGINPQRCGISLELDLQRWVELGWASLRRLLLRWPSCSVTTGRGHSFAGSSFPPHFDADYDQDKAISRQPLLVAQCWNIGYVSCSPQPTKNHMVFQDSAVVSVWSLSCSELWMKRVLEALGSTQELLELPVKFSLLQSGSGSVLPCKTVQSAPANLPRTTLNSPS